MRVRSVLIAAALVSVAALGQQAPPPTCDAPEHRQFDFWIGEWRVESAEGKLLGTNSISRDLASCVLLEHWRGVRGFEGKSFNLWNRAERRWHQTWVDQSGNLLLLDGGMDGPSMRLEWKGKQRDGTPVRHRITWTPIDREDCRGCVRQYWESAGADGEWKPVFEGFYKPAGG